MERDQGGVMGEIVEYQTLPLPVCAWCGGDHAESLCPKRHPIRVISGTLTTITAIVTKEMERGFTEQELAEAGGLQGAIAMVVLEAARYGTITEQAHEVKVT